MPGSGVWNLFNRRSLFPRVSGVHGLHHNPIFLAITTSIAAGQVAIVTFGGPVFQVAPLGLTDWLIFAGATASVLVYAEIVRRLRRMIGNPPPTSRV